MTEDSINKRYLYKLTTNAVGFIISLITAGIIPRALGVINYGNYNFVVKILTQLINLLDMRTSVCFYTSLSKDNKDNALVTLYGRWALLIVCILFILITGIIIFPSSHNFLLPNQTILLIYCCFLFVVIQWLFERIADIMDAQGLTVFLEKQRMINRMGGCIIIVLLYYTDNLNLPTFFIYQYLMFLILIIIFVAHLNKNKFKISLFLKLTNDYIKTMIRHFIDYSSPLAIYVIISFFVILFERWILQVYGGSIEQGLYSFSDALSRYCLLFVTALIPVFTRELAIAVSKNDIPAMAQLFRHYVPMLYIISVYFSCFIFSHADVIVRIFGGEEYYKAVIPLKILAFAPLVLTYSSLNSAVVYAKGNTKIFLKIMIILAPLDIFLAYFLMAKLNLGAIGISVKNVFLEFVSVCVILHVNVKYLNLSYVKFMFHMVCSIIPFLVICLAVKYLLDIFCSTQIHFVVLFFINGIIYTVLSLILIFIMPQLAGFNRDSLEQSMTKIFNRKNKTHGAR